MVSTYHENPHLFSGEEAGKQFGESEPHLPFSTQESASSAQYAKPEPHGDVCRPCLTSMPLAPLLTFTVRPVITASTRRRLCVRA